MATTTPEPLDATGDSGLGTGRDMAQVLANGTALAVCAPGRRSHKDLHITDAAGASAMCEVKKRQRA